MSLINNVSLIDYKGIDLNYSPYINCFKMDIIEDIVFITDLPPIQNITKFSANINSNVKEFIKTPKGKNCDGLKLTGIDALVSLKLLGRMEYISLNGELRIFTFDYIKDIYITLPEHFEHTFNITAKTYIQHISVRLTNPNSFYFAILCLNTLEF